MNISATSTAALSIKQSHPTDLFQEHLANIAKGHELGAGLTGRVVNAVLKSLTKLEGRAYGPMSEVVRLKSHFEALMPLVTDPDQVRALQLRVHEVVDKLTVPGRGSGGVKPALLKKIDTLAEAQISKLERKTARVFDTRFVR